MTLSVFFLLLTIGSWGIDHSFGAGLMFAMAFIVAVLAWKKVSFIKYPSIWMIVLFIIGAMLLPPVEEEDTTKESPAPLKTETSKENNVKKVEKTEPKETEEKKETATTEAKKTVAEKKETNNEDSSKENKQTESKPETSSEKATESPSAQKSTTSNGTTTSGTTNHIPVELVKTVDGDTIKIIYQGQEKNVRYLLIDTPETSHPRLGKQPFGEEAKERNRQLINSGKLSIEFDVGQRYDKYGRLLAYVYVDGKSVQQTLLREGLARVAYVYPPNTRHLDTFREAEAKAKAERLNIWSVDGYVDNSGFDSGSSSSSSASTGSSSSSGSTTTNKSQSGSSGSAGTSSSSGGSSENFANCTELRKVYPDGVPEGHKAYQSKMDRDKDGYACER